MTQIGACANVRFGDGPEQAPGFLSNSVGLRRRGRLRDTVGRAFSALGGRARPLASFSVSRKAVKDAKKEAFAFHFFARSAALRDPIESPACFKELEM